MAWHGAILQTTTTPRNCRNILRVARCGFRWDWSYIGSLISFQFLAPSTRRRLASCPERIGRDTCSMTKWQNIAAITRSRVSQFPKPLRTSSKPRSASQVLATSSGVWPPASEDAPPANALMRELITANLIRSDLQQADKSHLRRAFFLVLSSSRRKPMFAT